MQLSGASSEFHDHRLSSVLHSATPERHISPSQVWCCDQAWNASAFAVVRSSTSCMPVSAHAASAASLLSVDVAAHHWNPLCSYSVMAVGHAVGGGDGGGGVGGGEQKVILPASQYPLPPSPLLPSGRQSRMPPSECRAV